MHRRIIPILVAVAITISMAMPTFAVSSGSGPQKYLIKYVSSVSTKLDIKKGTAYISVKVRDAGKKSTKIVSTAYLQRKSGSSWKNIDSWTGSTTSGSLSITKSKKISKGTYRVKSVTKAYKGKTLETITDYSGTKSY